MYNPYGLGDNKTNTRPNTIDGMVKQNVPSGHIRTAKAQISLISAYVVRLHTI